MNLTDAQQRFLSTLGTGQAVTYAEGRESAYLLRFQTMRDVSDMERQFLPMRRSPII